MKEPMIVIATITFFLVVFFAKLWFINLIIEYISSKKLKSTEKPTTARPKFRKKWSRMSYEEKINCLFYFKEEALKDKYWFIRVEAYRAFGFTKEALKDKHWRIRLEAYRALGFTKEALKDKESIVRDEAKIFFNLLAK